MALSKVKIPIALGGKNEFDLSCDHQTSMNFLMAQPVYYRHLPRGEHFNSVVTGVIRPKPMYLPSFGRLRNNLRAFFVPYRLVYPQYDACRADVLSYNYSSADIPDTVPRFSSDILKQFFFKTDPFTTQYMYIEEVTSTDVYDFASAGHYYKFTSLGARYLKLLRSLGYEFLPGSSKTFYYDALALLAYAQIYLDWYANAQYLDSANIVAIRKILAYNDPTIALDLSLAEFSALMTLIIYVVYDTDEYFNAAWDTPVSPTATQFAVPSIVDNTVDSNPTSVATGTNGTPYMKQSAASSVNIGTQYIHDMLQALTNYQRRHALSGAREIDRALADFGFVSDYAALKRAVYIGNRSFDIQIGDVYSHADTSAQGDVSNLGDFAGRGFGNGQGSFDFDASEDGIIIVVSSIIPSCGIVQGYDRNNRHLSRFDFYDPNFEIGVQVLEKGEVYVSPVDTFYGNDDINALSQRFGYTGRYAEYKRPRSWWTSDSRLPSFDQGGAAWNLFRIFSDDTFGGDVANLTHSLNFTRAVDWNTFNRIFNYMKDDYDKFDVFYHHEVHCQSPMKPLFETYDFKEAHKAIKMDINGSKLN